ncbi:hypothetical protein B0T16DRAFT_497185 [Cercophora newfieldiana]|uniref:Uncharacterized protein n=1 Tax=Cercophora newfieldiana TaxID=92897 RepID=A0AA39XTB1_9PEZI|nr:hypothetical protein B0T16DRAFT_497185 [Cercophora newfieldiana]
MKCLLFVATATLHLLAAAQNANNCRPTPKSRNGADFVLTEQPDNANLPALADLLSSRRVSVATVFNDGNHKMTTDSSGRKLWEKTADFNDQDTTKWVPQGITSTADALEVGTYEGVDGWIVTWHRDDDKSVRVTFVDKKDGSYRHVLLVYPEEGSFREVPVHAGGVVWYGDTLWVVDTNNGIRVFDLGQIWRVDIGNGIGRVGDKWEARGYKYVIPQKRWYKWTSSFPFRFSYISLDRTATPDAIMVGEYQPNTTVPIRFAQFQLDYTTRRLRMDGHTAEATWAYCVDIERMQGAVQADGKIYISRSNGADPGDLFGWIPGNPAKNNVGFYPRSPEDLSYDKRGQKIYGLTEHAGKRYIITSDVSRVKF